MDARRTRVFPLSLKLHDKSGKNDDGIAAASDGGGGGEGDNASLPVGDGRILMMAR